MIHVRRIFDNKITTQHCGIKFIKSLVPVIYRLKLHNWRIWQTLVWKVAPIILKTSFRVVFWGKKTKWTASLDVFIPVYPNLMRNRGRKQDGDAVQLPQNIVVFANLPSKDPNCWCRTTIIESNLPLLPRYCLILHDHVVKDNARKK